MFHMTHLVCAVLLIDQGHHYCDFSYARGFDEEIFMIHPSSFSYLMVVGQVLKMTGYLWHKLL